MKELKLYLERIENTVVMRILKQINITEDLSKYLRVNHSPGLGLYEVYLRGKISEHDHATSCLCFFDVTEETRAVEYLSQIISWLDDVFYDNNKCLKVGDVIEVSSTGETWTERKLLAILPDSQKERYVCESGGASGNHTSWKHARIKKSGYNEEKRTYHGIIED